ncbi:hypothetical protein MMC07_007172 [Pseudocyphellaria aurata]|nr:hypothetical protein [Pseudocyphellaria aurata]
MDAADMQSPPQKKLKVSHLTMDGTFDDAMDATAASTDEPNADLPDNQLDVSHVEPIAHLPVHQQDQLDASHEHLRKEAECGITEFVSPELQGFTGVLKKRYTDFLVNEILPSGIVVHLDNLKLPQRDRPVEKSSNAKVEPLLSVGNASATHPPIVEPTSSDRQNDDGIRTDASSQQALDVQPSHDKEENGKSNNGTHEQGQDDKSKLTTQGDRALGLQPASGPRIKQKILMRQTSSELLLVGDNEEAGTQQKTARQALGTTGNGHEDNGPPQTPAQLNTESVGDIKDSDNNDTPEVSRTLAQPSSTADWQAFARASGSFQLSAEDKELLMIHLDVAVVDSILALYNRIIHSPHRKPREYGTVKLPNITDRVTRTTIHQAIRRIFNSRLESTTDDSNAMIVSAAAPQTTWTARTPADRNDGGWKGQRRGKIDGQDNSGQRRGKPAWQDLGGEYLHFTLCKENKDTMEVISYLARQLKMKPQAFQFAGTKDRRGITVQRVSVYRVYAERMMAAGRTLRNAKIGNFEYQSQGLQLGDLTGNEFIVTLRDCKIGDVETEPTVEKASQIVGAAIENLRARGFINYYGLQRFGTFATSTDGVGVKMLQGDFKAAVEAILEYSPASFAASRDPLSINGNISNDDKARAYALNLFKETGRLHPAVDELPKKFSAEASIIRHLANPERKNDYLGALQTISRNLRLMYVHAYQSLVWNVAASERWKRHGAKIIEGDLVLVNEHKEKSESANKVEEVDADGEVIIHPADDDRAGSIEDSFTRARALTKEEADCGDYSIFDIVLPTPGFDILYPANEMSDVYTNFMASERGGGLDPFDMRRKWKDVSLSGSYRKLLARPGDDVSFEIKTYVKENEQFVKTDLDQMSNGPPPKQYDLGHSADGAGSGKTPKDAEKIAVVLKLQLGTSQYATMALRELMKVGGVQTYKPDFGGGR